MFWAKVGSGTLDVAFRAGGANNWDGETNSSLPYRDTFGVPGDVTLTPRESEILALVAEGRSNGEIGKQLFISTKTVSVHVSNILAKLDAASRTEAAAVARRRGLI